MVLWTPNHVEMQCFWTSIFYGHSVESEKTEFFYFHHYWRYLNQTRSVHRYDLVILGDQVSREILEGNFLKGCTALLVT